MYNVQDYSVLYNYAVRPVICEDWDFTHIWKALARLWQHHFTKRGDLVHKTSLSPQLFLKCLYQCQERERSCKCKLKAYSRSD